MSDDSKIKEAYQLLRHVQPNKIERRRDDVITLCPDLEDEILQTVDIPLTLVTDTVNNCQYIACEFNRDLDSYRSPFSNQYFPALDDGQQIPDRLRRMEIMANTAFASYCHLYYTGGISSVYLWEIDDNVFGLGVFIKNEIDTELRGGQHIKGSIDCSDTIEVDESKETAVYKLTSSAIVNVEMECGVGEPLKISGSTSAAKVKNAKWASDEDHLINIGQLVESNSASFKDTIDGIFVGKMKQIMDTLANNDGRAQQAMMATAFAAQAKLRGKV